MRKKTTLSVSADLLDVNVWIALYSADHEHHLVARSYWRSSPAPSRLFCRITALGFLRLASTSRVMDDKTVTGTTALTRLEGAFNTDRVRMVSEPDGLDQALWDLASQLNISGGDWTDAYLAASAIAGNYRLVTLDRGFRRFSGLDLLLLKGD